MPDTVLKHFTEALELLQTVKGYREAIARGIKSREDSRFNRQLEILVETPTGVRQPALNLCIFEDTGYITGQLLSVVNSKDMVVVEDVFHGTGQHISQFQTHLAKGGATMIIRLGTQSSVIADRLACGDQRDRLNAIQEVLYRAQILMDAVTCDRIAMQDARTATCFAAFAPEHIADGLADGLADGAVGFMGKLCARTDDVSVQAQAQLEPEHGGAWWSMVEHGGAAS